MPGTTGATSTRSSVAATVITLGFLLGVAAIELPTIGLILTAVVVVGGGIYLGFKKNPSV